MDFGLINDNEHVFEIVRKTENSVKLSNGQEVRYLFHFVVSIRHFMIL